MSETQKPQMPAVDFSGFNPSEEEFKAALVDRGEYFRVGKHDVTIAEAVYEGQCEADDSWAKIKLTLNGTGKKTTNLWLLVPLKSHLFRTKKGTDTTFVFKKFVNFCEGLGTYVTKDNLPSVVKGMYPPSNLEGKSLTVNMDFTRPHPVRNLSGQTELRLVDGQSMLDDKGQVLTFADTASARAWCDSQVPKVDMTTRVEIVSFEKAPEAAPSNW